MFGSFDEKALAAYAEGVKRKRVKGGEGHEWSDNAGVGEHDHSFLDNDESQDAADYDFGACVREEKL